MKHIIFIASSLFLLSSCMGKNMETTAVVELVPSYQTSISETSPKIKDTKQFADCMQPSVSMCINQVGNTLAREQKSAEICKEIPGKESQDACAFGVVMAEASDKKDIGICETLSEMFRRECRVSMLVTEASVSRDIEKCNRIDTEIGTGTVDGRSDQCRISLIMQDSSLTEKACEILKTADQRNMCSMMIKNRPSQPNP